MTAAEQRISHPLATRGGIEFALAFFLGTGAMCPKCHHGTRVTSKNWARCKKCGVRVRRHTESAFIAAAFRATQEQETR